MNFRGIAGLAVLTLTAACDEPPGQVALGVHEAYERLAQTDLADFIFKRQCGILVHVRTEKQPDRSVTWQILSSGEEMLRFIVTLTPVDNQQTKVDIAVSRDANGHEAYDGTHFYTRPALMQPTRPAIEEQVAALLEGRNFDLSRLPAAPKDTVCNVQRAGLEEGTARFTIHDKPGSDS